MTDLEGVIYRKFDSDDVVLLRNRTIQKQISDGGEVSGVLVGELQKLSIILGIQKCAWFSDVINEDYGVSKDVFQKRYDKEFRKIPVQHIDVLFKKSQEFNKADFDVEELKKK